jgi:hypothetical protein
MECAETLRLMSKQIKDYNVDMKWSLIEGITLVFGGHLQSMLF